MSLIVNELLLCCRGLDNDKATERKKEVDRFKRLLQDPETLRELDSVSTTRAPRGSTQLTWDAVFRFLKKYLQKETELLKSGKVSVSASAQANRHKKMQEISSLMKFFIRCANKRGPKLKCADLLAHVVEVLQSSFSCAAYGEDYSSILLKDVLSVRKYWCEITQQQWHCLLDVYCGLFTASKSINRVSVSRIIHTLVQGCCLQTDSLSHTLFSFFSTALSNTRAERQLQVLENLISALNVFLWSVAMNRRRRVCSLGEELLPSVLYVWSEMRPSASLKEEMVAFFNTQLSVHHPKGAKTLETGAHAEDWEKWQKHLYSLYDALVQEISQIGSRGKYATGSRHIAVKENLIELTADICHQLFSQNSRAMSRDGTQSSKRRRIELGWETLRDHLQPHHSDFDMIPWLQVTAALASKYPSMLPAQEMPPLLSLLCQLLGEQQRRGERGSYVLRCLKQVALCQSKISGKSQAPSAELGRIWARVWALAVRGVSAAHTEALCLELLQTLVQCHLVPVDREFWKLFSGAVCKPSVVSALSLAQALCECSVPRSVYSTECVSSVLLETGSPTSLKEAIIDWLLMNEQSDEMEESVRLHPIICRNFPLNLIPKILVALTMKDSVAGMWYLMSSHQPECTSPPGRPAEPRALLNEIETLYLQVSFDDVASHRAAEENQRHRRCQEKPQLTVIDSLRSRVERSLQAVADHLLNSFSPDSPNTSPVCMVSCLSLLTGTLGAFVCIGLLTEESVCHTPLFQTAKTVAQDFSEYVTSTKTKLHEDETLSVLKSVMKMCSEIISSKNQDSVSTVSRRLIMKTLPARLLSELSEICKMMLGNSAKRDSAGVDNSPDDMEVSRTQLEENPQEEVDLFDESDGTRQSSDATQTLNTDLTDSQHGLGAKSPLSQEHLTKQDLTFLDTLEFLSLCTSFELGTGLTFKPLDLRRKLLKLLDLMDCAKPLHLHMYLVLLKVLPAETMMTLKADEFDLLLKPLADICSHYRLDQEMCCTILLALLPCVHCLYSPPEQGEDMGHVRGVVLQVLSGFCILGKSGKCTSAVRAALGRCLLALMEVDPCCKWAVLSLREEELPACVVLPSHLAEPHHLVRMQAAMNVERLFLEKVVCGKEQKKMLPLKHQQTAFENVYLKAQEGTKIPRNESPEDLPDETFNRRSTLLKSLSVVMCCSPVCEKQALFALFQSCKENNIEENMIKKVLVSVSLSLGYRSSEAFVCSHLNYLVAEWLNQRQTDITYTLQSFPYVLLNYSSLEEFYRSSYHVLIPRLVFLNDFEQVKSIASHLKQDWRQLVANCFPKIMVNILPHFAVPGHDAEAARQRENAHQVYELLKDDQCLGKQQIDSLICGNLAEIVVELLMTLYEGADAAERGDLQKFIGELDPAPNPPFFSSHVIKATLGYLSKCHSTSHRSLVAILSKTPMSIQKILTSVCQRAAETTNAYERHRILMMYHLFVNLLLCEVKDGLGGAWAFVLRDIIYTLIHHINSRSGHQDEVSARSLALCCDLLNTVCHTAIHFCDDALESHLQVIVGTLTAQVTEQPAISQQVLSLLKFLVIENPDNEYLRRAIPLLEPFPDRPAFAELRAAQHALKYSCGAFSLRQEIEHFLLVTSCDSLPLTRLEGLKDLKRQLHTHKQQVEQLVKECHADPSRSVLVKLVLNLLQLCKLAANHPGGRDILEAVGGCLGELGPVDLSTIALHHGNDQIYTQAASLYPENVHHQWVFIILSCMNNALTDHSISIRQAAAVCLKNILATSSGLDFWEMHKSQRDPMLLYLSPFRSAKRKEQTLRPEVTSASRDAVDSTELWLVQHGKHQEWIRNLCMALLDSGGVCSEALLMTRALCEVKTDFCQKMLPLFVHDMLLQDRDGSWRDLISTHIQRFFSSCCRSNVSGSRPNTPMPSDSGDTDAGAQSQSDTCSLRTMLAVIDYLRQQRRPLGPSSAECGTVCESNFWLDLNYLEVARAAQLCSAHFTALLYTEIYVDNIRNAMEEKHRAQSGTSRRITFDDSSQNLSISSMSEKSVEDLGMSLQDILIEVYRSIGEPDSLYGCGGGKLINPLTRIRTYEHEAMWGKALASYDLHANLPEVTRQVGIMEGLQNLGLCGILNTYLQGLRRHGAEWAPELREFHFQAAWRNTQWDTDVDERSEKLNPGFNESVFTALQALKDKDFFMFQQTLKYTRGSVVEALCRGSLEAVSSLYPALRSLQMIEEIQSAKQFFSESRQLDFYRKWHQHLDLLTDSDFSLVEPILALRSSIQETLLKCETDSDRRSFLSSTYSSHLMELCRLARAAGNTQLAEKAVFQMKQQNTVNVSTATSWAWQLEEAQVFWVKKEQGLALGLLKQMIDKLEDLVEVNYTVVPVYTECLRLCGSWLAETCLESPAVILETYLERAVTVGQGDSSEPKLQSLKTQSFLSLARFSDAQYQSIQNYMKSSEFENKQALLEKAREEVELMKERKVLDNRYTVKVQRELKLDVRALDNLKADRRRFLLKAVENYTRCLALGEEHDTWVFRLASLWLENVDMKDVNNLMKEAVEKIPSYKFLPLMYQLAARMGTKVSSLVFPEDVGFHNVLNKLICRSSMDHPHHTLFIILALVNANKDECFSRSRLSKSGTRQPSPLDLERADVAQNILNRIKKKKAHLIRSIETLCHAYITLAYMDASKHKTEKKAILIPKDQPITQIKDLDDVVIPTMEIKVDPSGRYEDLVTVRRFKPHFHLAGGVNLPKILDCEGSDGQSRRQLVKGQDDLRQDAVMQQVFQMCSTLLQRNADTRRRKLNIRCYKVVPFSQRSGVLEWCSGTVPIGEFLVDPQKGAHKRFRPQDWSSMNCRRKMMEAQKMEFDQKLQAYMEVCQNFRPVFRYFCMERFLDPAVWMEKRLAYTHSVATSSIVGYIVGLGDRHIQNILIDEQTAELVHIDLGVAFEQGKILPTPETVPFRLSRDIVDGMGINGVEGVFRRCCEKTMEVMRNSQEVLLTIVEVLLYDPLFDWTMNPLKAFYLQQQDEQAELNATLNPTPAGEEAETHRRHSSDSQSFNKVAERVLLRLQEKLKGVEEGTVLSVGGQVNLLIQQAMDPKNLSRLFPGWQAWV
ncbi:serine-protein kinase ATM isoform X3 [Tachysurus fulvidraco]|uniref:serine-protein kinase ATM isoform X3 n=1 Tax=Tachysurus fulvidraco TaxID=1234273 RepID=UPI001FF00A8E|nr:serine-protein kinase ATM isoform X3 [Tachysurus fulvidraco]